jgi:hypothetical protein
MPTITQRRKDELVQRASDHRDADRLRQGFGYFDGFNGKAKGCAIGCLAMPLKECAQPKEFSLDQEDCVDRLEDMGVPALLTRAAEEIFERIPQNRRRQWRNWPKQFAQALPVGKLTDSEVVAFIRSSTNFNIDYYEEYVGIIGGRPNALAAKKELLGWMRSLS